MHDCETKRGLPRQARPIPVKRLPIAARLVALGLVAWLGFACETEPLPFDVNSVAGLEAPEDAANLTAGESDRLDQLKRELTEEHGVRPRRYNGLLNGSNSAELCFVGTSAAVATFESGQMAARGFDETVDEAELVVNFITEGGYYLLDNGTTEGIDGFAALGVDTLVGNYGALKPYLHPTVRSAVEAGDRNQTNTNELGETVQSLTNMTLEEGQYANAGMYTWAKVVAASDMRKPGTLRAWCNKKGITPHSSLASINMAGLPRWKQFFWSTVYYNAGPGTGRTIMCRDGINAAESRWTQEDDANLHSQSALFNGLWRTATYRFMSGSLGDNTMASYCEQKGGQACTCDATPPPPPPPPGDDGGIDTGFTFDAGEDFCMEGFIGDPCPEMGCCADLICSEVAVDDLACCIPAEAFCPAEQCCGEMTCEDGACRARLETESCISARECAGSLLCNEGFCG